MDILGHVTEGTLRAYLDGELEPAQVEPMAAHLRTCRKCRSNLEELSARAATARHAAELLAPGPSELPPPVPVALVRFKQAAARSRRADSTRRPGMAALLHEGVTIMFNKKFRLVWATLALVAVLGILLSFAPVRAAASQFLGLFRVRKFAVVPIDPAVFSQDLDSAAVQEQMAQVFSDDVTVLREAGDPVEVASAEQASQQAGLRVRLPAVLDAPTTLEVQNGFEMSYRFDAERVRALLDMIGRDDLQVPAGLDGTLVHVDVQPVVGAQFGPDGKAFSLIQANSPSVDLPPNVDVNTMGEMLLQVWGLTPAEAHRTAAAIDWTSTLVIPLPVNTVAYSEVTVEGLPGLYIEGQEEGRGRSSFTPQEANRLQPAGPGQEEGRGRSSFTLLWQKDEVVYALMGPGTLERALEIANSMQ